MNEIVTAPTRRKWTLSELDRLHVPSFALRLADLDFDFDFGDEGLGEDSEA